MNVQVETPQSEALTEVVSFRVTESEKRAIRLIANADPDGLTESEVARRFFDSEALRAEGERLRAKLVA